MNPATSSGAARHRTRTSSAAARRTVDLDVPADNPTQHLALDLAREMRQRWRDGERPPAESFLARRPELWDLPEAAVELVYEEFCLRESAGEDGVEADILQRFPQWAAPLRVMLDCHRHLMQSDDDRPQFPAAGERVGEFLLLAELARGARGRVFLAAQTALAERPVVLKTTPLDGGGEHLSLARLQHTNIVPLYSVFDEPARRIRVLCMPYFGRATLASLLESLAPVPLGDRAGRHVVEVIDRMQDPPAAVVAGSAARQMLGHVSYVQAMCWITACLADALHFAHERGLVHLDLKPSNVLLAGDGQPMLLDFHLARGPVRPGGSLPENFGGTPPYMPPEQRAAMRSIQEGKPIDMTVDARADVYALGVMLYESLGGRAPVTADSPSAARINANVSVGLSDVIARCLAPRAEDRYAEAAGLADDLRRHLTDQSLAGVRNRSLAERFHKWRRRRPNRLRVSAMLAVVVAAGCVLLASLWANMHDRHEQAELALYDGQQLIRSGQHHAEAVKAFGRGIELLDGRPFERDLRQQLRDQLATARRLQLAGQLHQLADEIRILYGAESIAPPTKIATLASQCDAFWQKRDQVMETLGSAAAGADVATDFQDIAIFAADLHARLASPSADPEKPLQFLDEAEAMFGPSAVLQHQRGLLDPKSRGSPRLAARSAWEHYALGRAMLAAGDLAGAAMELDAALKLDPAGRWPNFYSGLCAYRGGRFDEAVSAFSVCIGAAPDVAGCYYNRALAYAALERHDDAFRDYDRALQLDPAHAAAALNRGMLHFKLGRSREAMADLSLALRHGADAATVHYDLALVHITARDRAVALDHVTQALKLDPAHQQALQLRDALQRQ